MVEDGNARVLDLLIQKYERKRWYCEPTNVMHVEARKANMLTAACRQTDTSVASHSPQAVSILSNFLMARVDLTTFQIDLFLAASL